MKSNSITIKDIAKALGLSYSTVSRALKDSYMISEPIKKKVKEYASEHNYKPNLQAQSLRSNKSRSIGVVLPAITNNFFAEVISGIESVAYEKDYKIIITQSFESYEREAKNLEYLAWHAIDGLLVSLSSETTDLSHLRSLHEKGIPVVFFDRVTDSLHTHTITADNKGGSYQATKHMIDCGYKRIAHITSAPGLSITRERLTGFRAALEEAGISINEQYIKYCEHGGMMQEEIERALEELFSLPEPPDALFTASDRITIGSMSFLHNHGLKIPDQVAIAGFSNFSAPELFNPSLTNIKQPAFEMGKTAIELLIRTIESKQPVKNFEHIILPTELFIRSSTRKRAAS